VQLGALAKEKVPAGQLVQDAALAAENVPACGEVGLRVGEFAQQKGGRLGAVSTDARAQQALQGYCHSRWSHRAHSQRR
jgi:hypothetical protein